MRLIDRLIGRKAENSTLPTSVGEPRIGGGYWTNTDLLADVDGAQLVGRNRYADIVMYTMIDVVRSALSGIRWTVQGGNPLQAIRLQRLLTAQTAWLYRTLIVSGECWLEYHDNVCRLLTDKDEAEGLVVPITSNEARWGMGSKYRMLRPLLDSLNVRMNAYLSITEGLGALGILSPDTSGGSLVNYSKDEREQVQRDYLQTHGVTRGKWKMLITPKPVKYQPINLPIKDLELREGIDHDIMMIAGYMRVPRELLPISGDATYANRHEAMQELRTVVVPDVCNNIYDCLSTALTPFGVKINWYDEATISDPNTSNI